MVKPLAVISCPIDTLSGYGARSRDVVKAIYEIKKDEWDIKILPQRWGSTSWGFIDSQQEEWGWLKSLFIQQLTIQPDYWFQITVPNEAQPVGKLYNVLITAGIETTLCDPSWIEGVNRMNITFVSSEHAKRVFEQSAFEQKDNNTGQIVRNIKLEKPVEVLFEGIDLNKYKQILDLESSPIVDCLDDIEEDFLFLTVGHWLPGEFGEDRKNIGLTIKLFLDSFKGKKGKKPALVLKTSHGPTSILDRDEILKKISQIIKLSGQDLPNVYLLHGEISDEEMNNLYNHDKIKCLVSLTKGEGYGRPLAEFTQSKKPVIASAWSGHLDFLKAENTILLPGELKNVHHSAVVQNMILPDSMWFNVNHKAAMDAMKLVYENPLKFVRHGKQLAHHVKTNFSYENMKYKLDILLGEFPKQVTLKLPSMSKIELPKLQKI